MNAHDRHEIGIQRLDRNVVLAASIVDIERHRATRVGTADRTLRCVSSGYLSGGCSCRSTIPTDVVTAAWGRELERDSTPADRFFHFTWRGEVWLAFGLADGRVRGVYCPTHRAERDERSLDLGVPEQAAVDELVLSA